MEGVKVIKFFLSLLFLTPLFPQLTVERFTLGNGLTVLINKNPSSPVAAVYTWVKVGYLDEPSMSIPLTIRFYPQNT